MEITNETDCLDTEYLRALLLLEKKLPIYIRSHIRECNICQGKIQNINIEKPISNSSFGRDFSKVLSSWKNEPPNEDERNQDIYPDSQFAYNTILFKFVYTHKHWIYIVGYVSVIVALIYYWFGTLEKH